MLACALSVGFFIRWLNCWAQQHADEEFYTKRFELDFARASFVVEWALEWSKDKAEMPEYLIERLSRNLFEPEATDVGPATVADAIASAIIGSAMQAEVIVGGQKFIVGKNGLRQKVKKVK